MRIKTVVILALLIATLSFGYSCKKQNIRKNACSGSMHIDQTVSGADTLIFLVPNIFTPNGDNKNDRFAPKVGTGVRVKEMRIYKGNKKIYTDVNSIGWNGVYKSKIREGFFRYEIDLDAPGGEIKLSGDFALIITDESLQGIENCEDCRFSDMMCPRKGLKYTTSENTSCRLELE